MLQQIAGKALLLYCHHKSRSYPLTNTSGTCSYMRISANSVLLRKFGTRATYISIADTTGKVAVKLYKDFTGAKSDAYGFKSIPRNMWINMTPKERESFRLDMLYYFWMANQEM